MFFHPVRKKNEIGILAFLKHLLFAKNFSKNFAVINFL